MLTISLWGDYAPVRRFEPIVLQSGRRVFGDLVDVIRDADISVVNLESPLCKGGEPVQKVGPAIRANPACITAIADAGFDVIGLANNHIMDYGERGLAETVAVAKQHGLRTVGAGVDLTDAQSPLIIPVRNRTIGIIAVAEQEFNIATKNAAGAAPLDVVELMNQIQSIRGTTDLILVSIHGGNEFFPFPRPALRKMCWALIRCGADGVVCHHSHVPGAYEIIDGKPIVYGLGNLIFDHSSPPSKWNCGYGVVLRYNDNTLEHMAIVPYVQNVGQGGARRLKGQDEATFLQYLDTLNSILQDGSKYEEEWVRFVNQNAASYAVQLQAPIIIPGIGRAARLVPKITSLLHRRSLRTKLNLVRCESHRELLVAALELIDQKRGPDV